jgi:hypothetical protein
VVEPIFWLGLSILLVAVSLTAVLVAALPAFRELARAARSAEKLFDTLSRELPPTLEAIRLTGLEITDLTGDVSEGVQSAGQVVKQVDQSLRVAKKQAKQAQVTTRSLFAGVKAAWKTLQQPPRRPIDRLPPSTQEAVDFGDRDAAATDRYHPRDFQRSYQRDSYSEGYPEGYLEDSYLEQDRDWEDQQLTEAQEELAYQQSKRSSQDATNWEDESATTALPKPTHPLSDS